jgi:hypothetical protein
MRLQWMGDVDAAIGPKPEPAALGAGLYQKGVEVSTAAGSGHCPAGTTGLRLSFDAPN